MTKAIITNSENTELDIYEVSVKYLAENKVDNIIYNSGEEHALIIFENIFNNCKYKLRLLSGNLSNGITKNPKYINSLTRFLAQRNGKLEIILDRYEDGSKVVNSDLFKKLETYKDQITIKKSTLSYSLNNENKVDSERKHIHFCIGDDHIFRLETDTEKRKAKCNFNDITYSNILKDLFYRLYNQSELLSWDTLIPNTKS